jgi:hypothetical protein
MTRPIEEVHSVLALRSEGLGARRIARLTGIPVKTVQGWITDPKVALERPPHSGLDCKGKCEPWVNVHRQNYAYLLGMYLGDGHMVRVGGSYRLSIYCDLKYPGIISEVRKSVETAMPKNRVNAIPRDGCTAVGSYSTHWPCLFPQHGKGMKHERPIVLAPWQRAIVEQYPRPFVRGLIHSDGWRGENVAIRTTDLAIEYHTYTRYQISNRSDDIRGLFCWALDLIDVHWTQSYKWTISVARRKDVHYLDSFVGPKR